MANGLKVGDIDILGVIKMASVITRALAKLFAVKHC
jgi:hypothetical protein